MNMVSMFRPFGAPRIHFDEAGTGGSPATVTASSEASAAISPPILAQRPEGTLSATEAARMLASRRREKPAASETPAAPEPKEAPAAAAPETPEKPESKTEAPAKVDGAAPVEKPATGETDDNAKAPVEKQPRPLPRSWTKEQADNWNALPESVQELLTEQDKKASDAVRKAQNDAATHAKDLTSKLEVAEKVRTEYEAKAQKAMDILLREQTRDFPDIKSDADVAKLAVEDPVRWVQWQQHQAELQAQAGEVEAAKQRSTEARNSARNDYATAQMEALRAAYPEFTDPKVQQATLSEALPLLDTYGFDRDTLGTLLKGESGYKALNSAGFQRLVVDLMRANKQIEGHKAVTAAHAKEVADLKAKLVPPETPPVVRPGAAPERNQSDSVTLAGLSKQLTTSNSLKDGLALLKARRANR